MKGFFKDIKNVLVPRMVGGFVDAHLIIMLQNLNICYIRIIVYYHNLSKFMNFINSKMYQNVYNN